MSIWYEAKDEETDLDFEQNQVDIMVFADYNGGNYVTLTFEQIEEIYKKINKAKTKGQQWSL